MTAPPPGSVSDESPQGLSPFHGVAAHMPTIAWDGANLVAPDGSPVTDAQQAKARRYLRDGGIRLVGSTDTAQGWGLPHKTVESYEIAPIPGTHQVRHVTVTTHLNGAEQVTARDWSCDCQRATGTSRSDPATCSHVLAVHAYRQLTPSTQPEASETPA